MSPGVIIVHGLFRGQAEFETAAEKVSDRGAHGVIPFAAEVVHIFVVFEGCVGTREVGFRIAS